MPEQIFWCLQNFTPYIKLSWALEGFSLWIWHLITEGNVFETVIFENFLLQPVALVFTVFFFFLTFLQLFSNSMSIAVAHLDVLCFRQNIFLGNGFILFHKIMFVHAIWKIYCSLLVTLLLHFLHASILVVIDTASFKHYLLSCNVPKIPHAPHSGWDSSFLDWTCLESSWVWVVINIFWYYTSEIFRSDNL